MANNFPAACLRDMDIYADIGARALVSKKPGTRANVYCTVTERIPKLAEETVA